MQIKPRDEEGMKVIGTGTGHGFPQGTYAHVRGGYLTENNERKFRLVEIQSDWAQNASSRIKDLQSELNGKLDPYTNSPPQIRPEEPAPMGEIDYEGIFGVHGVLSRFVDTDESEPIGSNFRYTVDRYLLLDKLLDGVFEGEIESEGSFAEQNIDSSIFEQDILLEDFYFRAARSALDNVTFEFVLGDTEYENSGIPENKNLVSEINNYETELSTTEAELSRAINNQSMPFMEQDSWATMGIKNLLVHMVDHGVDVLEIPWGSIQTDLYGNGDETKGVAYFYNRILMNRLKFLKSYGIQPEIVAEGQDTFNESRYVPDVLMAENYFRDVKVVEAPKNRLDIFEGKTLDGKEIDPDEDYYLIEVPANDLDDAYRNISTKRFRTLADNVEEIEEAEKRPTYYSVGAGEKAKIVFFKTEKQARKFVEPLKEELTGTLVGGYRRIKLTEELKDAIREGNLPLFSESWRTKLSTATKPEITIKTKAKKQTLLDINKRPLEDLSDNIKDVLPFTGENKNSFAAGLDSLIDAGMPKILLNSVKQFGQMPSKNKSGVTYPDQGIVAINQKELADANKGEANARWSVTSLLAHEYAHIPDAVNRIPEYNDGNTSDELLSRTSPFFLDQNIDLTTVGNFSMQDPNPIGFGPITQEAYEIYNNDIEGLGQFLAYPMADWTTTMTDAAQGNTSKLEWFLGEVQAQMSALYRTNPELLAKHAPEAYKFYRRLDYVLSQKNNPNVGTAKSIRKHFRSSSPTRGQESLRSRDASTDGRGSSGEGGAISGMGREGPD